MEGERRESRGGAEGGWRRERARPKNRQVVGVENVVIVGELLLSVHIGTASMTCDVRCGCTCACACLYAAGSAEGREGVLREKKHTATKGGAPVARVE